MFQEKRALLIYCVSPVHMGAGTAVGLIDNPIQRETHTDYPMMAGSGLKGAVRHHVKSAWNDDRIVKRLFGPDSGTQELNAGAVSFGDAQLVAFPVRCTRRAYVYATSPTALACARRQLALLGNNVPEWPDVSVVEGHCGVASSELLGGDDGNKLHLEVLELKADGGAEEAVGQVASWLADNALPQGDAYQYFRDKLRRDLVIVPDEEFGYFVRNATVVEPHVRINDDTGTAADGGLFYTENLPPETVLLAPVMASTERTPENRRDGEEPMTAERVMEALLSGPDGDKRGLQGALLQVGGDATTGRGQVVLRAV